MPSGNVDSELLPVTLQDCSQSNTLPIPHLAVYTNLYHRYTADFALRLLDATGNFTVVPNGYTYSFDFGDGSAGVTTTAPAATHDYSASVVPHQQLISKLVTVNVKDPNGVVTVVKATVTLFNLYALNYAKGQVTPDVTSTVAGTASWTLSVPNVESTPLSSADEVKLTALRFDAAESAPSASQ